MYKAVLFAPDGEWVTDFSNSETIEEVQEALCSMGSRWYFYPFHAVIVDRGSLTTNTQRLIDIPYPFEGFKGRSIRSLSIYLSERSESDLEAMLRS